MSDNFQFVGAWSTTPLGQPTSFVAGITTPIQESFVLSAKSLGEFVLTEDSAMALPFGGVTNANIVIMKALPGGGPVTAAVTSAAGTAQKDPFDTYFINMSEGVPITAITLTRTAGVLTTVEFFLGQSD